MQGHDGLLARQFPIALSCASTSTAALGWLILRINGTLQDLWRAIDQDGEVLDIMVQPKRNRGAGETPLSPTP